jgi:hypothetical protein
MPLGAAVGALCGLAALIRPTDAVAVLITCFWGLEFRKSSDSRTFCNSGGSSAGRCSGDFLRWRSFKSAAIYWKYASGHWLVYSYQDQEFSWLHPHVGIML